MTPDSTASAEPATPIALVPYNNIPIVLVGVLGALAWLTVGLRVFTRIYLIRGLGWDDATMVLALVCSLRLHRVLSKHWQLFFSVYNIGFVMSHILVNGQSSLTESRLKYAVIVCLLFFYPYLALY
jgi:hypothetical protein